MAAGRVDVLRRSDYHKYSKRKFESYRNRVYSGDGVKDRNGYHLHVDVCNSRGHGGLSKASEPSWKTRKIENPVQLPPEKKRKFSPIVWDLVEKVVRVSSKKGLVPLSTPHTTPARLSEVVSDAVSDGGISKSPSSVIKPCVTDGLVGSSQLEAPADLSTQLHSEQAQKNTQDEEFPHPSSISLSRWSSDHDSPGDASEDLHSSPESGEIRNEGFEGSQTRTSDKEVSSVGDKYYAEELCAEHVGNDNHGGNRSGSEDSVDLPPMQEPVVPMQRSINMLQGCRSVSRYERLKKINEGTYGVVYKAKHKQTGEIVAIKKMKMSEDAGDDHDFPITALREINLLWSLNHPSIVGVKEVVMDDADEVYMVMEYMEYDLKGLIESERHPFSTGEIKYLMLQLLKGVQNLHDNWILHRDLKPSNLLLNKAGELKICDFGMSRQYGSPLKPYTSLVVTLWYRAPELLLGGKQYSTAVDMWSIGCIMAELLAKEPLFNGKDEADQIHKIFTTLGRPDEKSGLSRLPGLKANSVKQPHNHLRMKFPGVSFSGSSPVLSASGFDLLNSLLCYNPVKRITAKAALNHRWFREFPEPTSDFKPINYS